MTAAASGTELNIGAVAPGAGDDSNSVSAEVVRDAIAGTYAPLHQRGLRASGLHIEGDIDLSYLQWQGRVSLTACLVTGEINLDYARPTGLISFDRSHVQRITAVGAVIDGSFSMRELFCERGLYVIGIQVSGSFRVNGSHIIAPEAMLKRNAIELFRGRLGDLFMQRARIDGGVYAAGTTIARNARIHGSHIRSRTAMGWGDEADVVGAAVVLAGSDIGGSLVVSTPPTRGQLRLEGTLDLRSTTCRRLRIYSEVFDETDVALDGLVYTRLSELSPTELLAALNSSRTFHTQPYVQLASYCADIGQTTTRQKALVALEQRVTRELPRRSLARIRRILHGALVGYGYRTAQAVPWLLFCLAASSSLLHFRGSFAVFKAQPGSPEQAFHDHLVPWSDSIGLTLDNLLPFASLGIKDEWSAHAQSPSEWGWLAVFLALKFSAWGLVALALASITGIVRRSQ